MSRGDFVPSTEVPAALQCYPAAAGRKGASQKKRCVGLNWDWCAGIKTSSEPPGKIPFTVCSCSSTQMRKMNPQMSHNDQEFMLLPAMMCVVPLAPKICVQDQLSTKMMEQNNHVWIDSSS